MAKTPLQIGGLYFPTRKAASEHFREILWGRPRYARLTEPDHTHLRWLVERHHEYVQKAGAGIDYFIIVDTVYSAVGFNIVRIDGSTVDFSYITALDGQAPSAMRETLAALRWEVTDDILRAKADYFRQHANADGTVACAITGQRITWKQSHADHAPPFFFRTLADTFLTARNITLTPDLLKPSADHQIMQRLADRALAEDWRAFHHKLANIRVVKAYENTARAGQARVREKDRQLQLL
jgi:hypothetical protein